MFSYLHLADTTRLMGLGYPLPYILLAIPFAYLFTTPAGCLFQPVRDPLTSNKSLATAGSPRLDSQFFLGLLAGSSVLLHSYVANMVYLSAALLFSAFSHRPL
jgi:hypothetical protein